MHKVEFIDYIAKQHKVTKVEADHIIDTFTSSVTSALAEGKEIILLGFGKFHTTKVAAREGRNPATGKPMKIAAYVQPRFSVGSRLKAECNGGKSDSKTKKNNSQKK